jgi:PTH1 family peptidyl-tRNA hydrolase
VAHDGPVALLLAGLGNPGSAYDGTRHNAGAMAVERLAARLGVRLRRDRDLGARIGRDGDTLLAIPDAFMNESGPPVARVMRAFDAPRPLVVADDLDLPPGAIRFRVKGGAGGHNGLRSVITALGTREFPRLKIGIGRPATRAEVTDWVLTRPTADERRAFEDSLDRAADALAVAAAHGLARAMTEHSA